jgi:hypothetical protein
MCELTRPSKSVTSARLFLPPDNPLEKCLFISVIRDVLKYRSNLALIFITGLFKDVPLFYNRIPLYNKHPFSV